MSEEKVHTEDTTSEEKDVNSPVEEHVEEAKSSAEEAEKESGEDEVSGEKKDKKSKEKGKRSFFSRKSKKEEELEEEVERLNKQVEELTDKYRRLFAEFDNAKKRMAKEKLELMKTAGAEVITGLLPVLDDFERAEKTLQESDNVDALREGVELIKHKFYKSLEQAGLKPMDAQGKDFNSDHHDALTEIPAPSEELKGKVVDVIEKGYFLNDKIIRYAKVVVGK